MLDFGLGIVIALLGFTRWRLTPEPTPHQDRDRRLGGSEQTRMFNQALASGVVPPNAARAAWTRELRGDHPTPRPRFLVRVLDGIIIVCIAVQIVASVRTASPREILFGIACVAGLLLIFEAIVLFRKLRPSDEAKDEARLLRQLERDAIAYNVVQDVGTRRVLRRRDRR